MEFQDKHEAELAVEISDYETERGKPMPSNNHSIIQSQINFLLKLHYGDIYRIHSELSLDLSTGKGTPDLAVYPKKKTDYRHDIIRVTEPPLAAIEILSPTQSFQEVSDKIGQLYLAAGVKSAWLVVPTIEIVHVYTPDGEVATFTTGKLHDPAIGVELELSQIFE